MNELEKYIKSIEDRMMEAARNNSECMQEAIQAAADSINNEVRIGKISVVNEDGNIVAATDFTNESENLEVWKAIGLEEEDFYKR